MSKTTWAVLSDGRYLKVMVNNGENKKLNVLDADKHEDLATLCYKMVNSKPEFSPKGSVKAEKINFVQLQADFLAEQYNKELYERLVIAAPADVAKSLRAALPENIEQLVAGELAEDITTKSADIIEAKLVDLIAA
ncbi:MAG: host attachment protein [Gammaproteobacteria bacterium]|jgi:protein required for attachment to host cells